MEEIQLYASGGDDTAMLQAAIDSAIALCQELHLASGTYRVSSTLIVNQPLTMRGQGRSGNGLVRIEAIAPMESVIEIRAMVDFENLYICGSSASFGTQRYSKYGFFIAGCGPSHFHSVHVVDHLVDGWHFAAQGINDKADFRDISGSACGTLYLDPSLMPSFPHGAAHQRVVGTLSASVELVQDSDLITRAVLTCSGGQFLTWGVRRGDPVLLGTQFAVVLSVQSESTLILESPITASNAPLAIAVGSGWFEARWGDNNLHNIYNGLFRGNAAHGMALDGLYGHLVAGVQFDYNAFHAVRVGVTGGDPVLSPSFVRCYFESNGRKPFLLGSTQGMSIISPSTDVTGDPWEYVSPGHVHTVTGTYQGQHGLNPLGTTAHITSRIPSLVIGEPWAGSESYGLQQTMGRPMLPLPDAPPGYSYASGGKLEARANLMLLYTNGADREITGLTNYTSDPAKPLSGHPIVTLVLYQGGFSITFKHGPYFKLSTGADVVLTEHQTLTMAHIGNGIWVETARSVPPAPPA